MKSTTTAALSVALLITLMVVGGCASGSKMTRTEEGYKPTHVIVGDVVAYTQGVAQVSTSDVKQVISDELEIAFRQQGLKFVSLRELETTPVPATDLVKLNATVSFQQSSSGMSNNQTTNLPQSMDARYNYMLVRTSDGFLWQEGSAKTTDWTVSQGATMDVLSAIKFGAQATVREVKELME